MIKFLPIVLSFGLFCITFFFPGAVPVMAAGDPPLRSQGQIEATILHVDKYGVYIPGLVFYWDSSLPKQRIDLLTRTAEQLKNKKAMIVYSAAGELPQDKRPLMVDVAPVKEDPKPIARKEAAQSEYASDAPHPSQYPPQPPPPSAPSSPHSADAEQETEEVGGALSSLFSSLSNDRPHPTASRSASISRDEVASFIQRVLRLNESKDLNLVIECYADQVNYYDRGVVDRAYIKRDMGYYFKNWGRISAILEGDVVLIVTDQPDVRITKFVSQYEVENAKKSIRGKVENVWWLQRVNGSLKIIDQKQKILSSETTPRQ